MRKITTVVEGEALEKFEAAIVKGSTVDSLELPYDTRKKSRFKAELNSGEQVGVVLPRGKVLRGGDVLADENGGYVRIIAAAERLSRVHSEDPCLLARAAYHLGNRHLPLQVGAGWLVYQHDHVLDAMVQGLGLQVDIQEMSFEPEEGAYAAHSKNVGKGHGHSH